MRQDEMKLQFIKQAVTRYRKLAQQQILNDPKFADFADQVHYLQQAKQETRMPVQ
jgi:hypothetical protein